MSSIRDYRVSQDDSDTLTHTGVLPVNQSGDLLVWFVARDGTAGAELTTPSGWTKLFGSDQNSSDVRTQTYYKVSNGSETNPSVTGTDSDGFASVMWAVKNVDSGTPVDAFVGGFQNNTSYSQFDQLVTTTADCLILYAAAGDGERGIIFDPSDQTVTALAAEDVGGVSMCAGWSFQQLAGNAPRPSVMQYRTDGCVKVAIAIRDDGSGDVPGYIDPSSPPVEIIHPLFGSRTDSNWGGSFVSGGGGLLTTINGISVVAPNNRIDYLNSGLVIGHQTLEVQTLTAQLDQWSIFELTFDAPINLSGQIGVVHQQAIAPRYARHIHYNSDGGGTVWVIADSNNNWTAWSVTGRDSRPNIRTMIPSVVEFDSVNFDVDSSGTIDLTDITRMYLGNHCSDNTEVIFSMIQLVKTAVIVGGSSVSPAGFDVLANFQEFGLNQLINQQNGQAQNQILSFQPIQIGNGTTPTYLEVSGASVEFPAAADGQQKTQYQVGAGKVGLTIDASDGDTIIIESSSFSGASLWNYTWAVGTSQLATYRFNGKQVIGANVSLQPLGFAVAGMTFDRCTRIFHNGADLSGGNTISNTQAARAITVTSQADLDKLANCTFSGNGVAMRVDVAGSVSLSADNIKFSGNTVDIEYTGSGTLTFQNGNGSNAVSSSVTGGGTVVIESSATLSFTGVQIGSDVVIYDPSVVADGSGGNVVETFDSVAGSTVAYQYSAAPPTVDVGFFNSGFKPFYIRGVALNGVDATIPVAQTPDPSYSAV